MDNLQFLNLKTLVDDHILDFLPEIDNKSITVYEAMRYSLLAGGKRLRPVLLLAACDFAGGQVQEALPFACAMEYIQTYSLIHDDLPVMDNDDFRRGVPTNHKVYGEAMALLAGDGLLSCAFEAMSKDMLMYFDSPAKLKLRVKAAFEISKGAGCRGMVAGQVADIEAESRQCSKEMLDYIHLNKTAAMIVAAIRSGAFLGNADCNLLTAMTEYGECIGLAFQIRDDVLDIVGDKTTLGKSIQKDIAENKATYPALYGMEESIAKIEELTDKGKKALEPYFHRGGIEFFIDLANELAVRSY